MGIKVGYKILLEQAQAEIETITVEDDPHAAPWRGADSLALVHRVEEAKGYLGHPEYVFVDLRDIRELQREGKIPGAFHAPRGMLEFWVDPESPYHKPIFASGKKFVFYCAGGWRSALAAQTVQRMGLEPVCHIAGGFKAWLEAGGAVERLEGPKNQS